MSEYPGDVHWYDLPDDEAELEEPVPESRLWRLIPWRRRDPFQKDRE